MIKPFSMALDGTGIWRRHAWQPVRLAAALFVLSTLSLSSVRPVAAAVHDGMSMDAGIKHDPDRPGRVGRAKNGSASKEAYRASLYAAIRQKHSRAESTGNVTPRPRAYFR